MGLQKIADDWRYQGLFFILILFLAVFLRTVPFVSYQTFLEPDSYFHGRMVATSFQTGSIPAEDTRTYSPMALQNMPTAYWELNVFIYKIFWVNYSQENLLLLMAIFPVLWGCLAVIFIFLAVRKIYGTNPGLVAAFVMAIIPAFVYRTSWGFFEDDSIIFFLLSLFLYFFVWLIVAKEEDFKNTKKVIFYIIAAIISLVLLHSVWAIGELLIFVIVIAWGMAILKHMSQKASFILCIGVISLALSIFLFVPTLSGSNAILVGEEALGYPLFFQFLNVLIIFPLIACMAIPFSDKKENPFFSFFIFLMTIALLFFAFYKAKYIFLLGLPIALCAAYVFYNFPKFRIMIAVVLLVSLSLSAVFIFEQTPSMEKYLPAIKTMNDKDCNVFNWWDTGHILTFYTNCKVWEDNRSYTLEGHKLYANFVFGIYDCNEIQKYGFTYFFFPKDFVKSQDKLKILMAYSDLGEKQRKESLDYSCIEKKFEDDNSLIYKIIDNN